METNAQKINRARRALEGLTVGDCFGETFFPGFAGFEDRSKSLEDLIADRTLAVTDWFWTDDSQMAFSIYKNLAEFGEIEQSALAQSFADRYEVGRGYGSGMHQLLRRIRAGEDWETAARSMFEGQGSWGNGSAMRVAPVGGFFADDLKRVCEEAEKSAVVTHTHEEAIVGAQAVALAAALAWRFRQENLKPSRSEFIDAVLPFLAPTETTAKIRRARDLNRDIETLHAADILGNGIRISCPDTVPFCLFAAGEFLDDYETALWETVAALGDRDTTCAIVGGIVVMFAGLDSIPASWLEKREPVPAWVSNV
ncbi:MAG: ADP-ribosylglycohydrolase family protein [Acidobacteria bacterium]|nr:ADP-ribosylglycohydrolase family protein [Acidobacteriota bacterium]